MTLPTEEALRPPRRLALEMAIDSTSDPGIRRARVLLSLVDRMAAEGPEIGGLGYLIQDDRIELERHFDVVRRQPHRVWRLPTTTAQVAPLDRWEVQAIDLLRQRPVASWGGLRILMQALLQRTRTVIPAQDDWMACGKETRLRHLNALVDAGLAVRVNDSPATYVLKGDRYARLAIRDPRPRPTTAQPDPPRRAGVRRDSGDHRRVQSPPPRPTRPAASLPVARFLPISVGGVPTEHAGEADLRRGLAELDTRADLLRKHLMRTVHDAIAIRQLLEGQIVAVATDQGVEARRPTEAELVRKKLGLNSFTGEPK